MRYVLRTDRDSGGALLYNTVTGQLAALDPAETEALDALPSADGSALAQLIADHYLVPEGFDEHQQVKALRTILLRLRAAEEEGCKGITTYTILTTTACNARCYYCFEQGARTVTMTEQTAQDTAAFIASHCGPEKKVFLTWFGGEPTLTTDRIDQICLALRQSGVSYESTLVTNGYLLDRDTVAKARDLWQLQYVQICVDGTEENHNRIKAYVNAADSPYQRVFRNTAYLLEAGVRVRLRMNFDLGNVRDFLPFVEEVTRRFARHPLLTVSAHPVVGTYRGPDGEIAHGSDEWFEEMIPELTDIAEAAGLYHREMQLPGLNCRMCMAARDYAVTVTPEGFLTKCPEQFGENQIVGSLREGIRNAPLAEDWKRIADSARCAECALFPLCVSPVNCLTSGQCLYYSERIRELTRAMRWQELAHTDPVRGIKSGGETHEISGTEDGICAH